MRRSIALIAIAVGLAIAVAYSFHHKPLNVALLIWIDLFRSFPVLVLLILFIQRRPRGMFPLKGRAVEA